MAKKNGNYPSKTTLNLYAKEYSFGSPVKVILLLIVLLAVVAAFAKFAVIDLLAAASAAQNETYRAEAALAEAQRAAADYDEVKEQYERLIFSGIGDDAAAVVDRLEVIELLENKVMPVAGTTSWTIIGNVVSLQLTGITLSQTSDLIHSLGQSDIVEAVKVYTVNAVNPETGEADTPVLMTDENDQGDFMPATVSMTILLSPEGGDR